MNEAEILAKYDKSKTFTEHFTGKTSLTLSEVESQLLDFMLDLHTLDDTARADFCKKYVAHDLQVKEQELFALYSRLLEANRKAAKAPLKAINLKGFILMWDTGSHGGEKDQQLLHLAELVHYNGLYDFLLDLLCLSEADQRQVNELLTQAAKKFCQPVFALIRRLKDNGQLNNLPPFYL